MSARNSPPRKSRILLLATLLKANIRKIHFATTDICLQMPNGKLEVLKEQIYKTAVDILLAYREKVARTASSGQLILPESLKLLPLYALALTKINALRSARPHEQTEHPENSHEQLMRSQSSVATNAVAYLM